MCIFIFVHTEISYSTLVSHAYFFFTLLSTWDQSPHLSGELNTGKTIESFPSVCDGSFAQPTSAHYHQKTGLLSNIAVG